MYVPGDDEKKLKKVESLDVDCIVMNCEDGVAANRKEEARRTIRKVLGELQFKRAECAVRVNALSSNLTEDDLGVILLSERLPEAIVLPKVETVEDLNLFESMTRFKLRDRKLQNPFRLIFMIESAIGLINMKDIAKAANSLRERGVFCAEAVIFGSDDFIADIGASKEENLANLVYVRQKIVTIAKAFNLQAIDAVHINLKDDLGLKTISEEGAALGFTGKQVIHPAQIDIVQKAFSPSEEKVNEAKRLIEAYNEHQLSGKGAFTFRQKMIDRPLLLQAEQLISMSEALKLS
ncbi:DgyrCDS11046 [Dimorphilus gyrociliatus]|uniref:Citramalyl-CoA lyase, mitochondrial n=1 Tax=Dimorphilus gyrociliatus TaxID=2664684 RepID=A0A7I8W2A4_9ANNE|nr:DgyrCDS11046 [Dimorphilus gyrociliatus]